MLSKLNRLKIFFVAMGLVTSISSYAQGSPPWPSLNQVTSDSKPYFFYFDGDTVRTALIKVAQNFDVKVHFSQDLSEEILNRKLSGRFKVASPEELFNKFSSNFAFSWFYYSGVLHVAPSEFETRNFHVASDLISNFKYILNNEGILDPRFGWSELPSEGLIIVSGPKDYLNIIDKKVLALKISPINQQFAIFHLKYASAVDTTIELNHNQVVIPGVASILKLMLQPNLDSLSESDNKILRQVVEPLKNDLKSIMPNAPITQLASGQTSRNTGVEDRKPVVSSAIIQADNRLNTIIIRDKSSNIALYKTLIDLLDIPAPLIQIQVLILDIDQVKMNSSGINWWASNGGNLSGGFGANNLASAQSAGSPSLFTSFGSVSPGNLIVNNVKSFMAGLRYLENKGYAKAESKSAVVTIDNIAAVVNLTESFYQQNMQNQQNQQNSPIQTQMQMQVVPHLIYEGTDKKRIKLTVSLKDGNVEEKTINGLPVTLQGDLNSQAVIEEGSSLLLAGFTHKQSEQTESKVPILGDIPILGWFFKTKESSNRELQRSYLVTPQVIWSDSNEKIPNYSLLNK